jgi:hypothetical protein
MDRNRNTISLDAEARTSSDQDLLSPLLIVTYPRTASNLLMRMLSFPDQNDVVSVESGGYFFMPAIWKLRELRLLDRHWSAWTSAEWASLEHVYVSCAQGLKDLLRVSRVTRKRAIFKEHAPFLISPNVQSAYVSGLNSTACPWKINMTNCYPVFDHKPCADLPPNETVLESNFLAHCVPSFLIRHPALAFPSYYRVIQSFRGKANTVIEPALLEVLTIRWTRQLYDWFLHLGSNGSAVHRQDPVILDADDFLSDPGILSRFCELVGLDAAKIQHQWAPATNEQLTAVPTVRLHTRSTLYASSGIVPGKTFHGMSIEGELEKWKKEFGHLTAMRLHSLVLNAMPDYEYLFERRLQISPKVMA